MSPTTRKRRDMGIGTYPELSLADARKAAMHARELIALGKDPIDERKALQQAADSPLVENTPLTFAEAARRVHTTICTGFRNAKHAAQWLTTLETYVFPKLGNRPVKDLSARDFAEVLLPIWLQIPETASRVKQRCDRVMMWCVAAREADYNPVASVKALLPAQSSKRTGSEHHPAVPWQQMPDAMQILSRPATKGASRPALLFLIYTAARSGEVRGARWEEIDFLEKVWTVPKDRMKAGVTQRVPLSTQAMDLIAQRLDLKDESPYIFANQKGGALSDMALTKILRATKLTSDVDGRLPTAHGFRSSFRDWASENGKPRDLAERALAHTIQNAVEAAYHRTDLLEQRRPMMQEWADFISG